MKKIPVLILIGVFCLLSLSGCNGRVGGGDAPYIYYIKSTITALVAEPYTGSSNPGVEELIIALQTPTNTEGAVAPLSGITVLSTSYVDKKLVIEFGHEYGLLSGTRELLTRAAVVKTLSQVEGVDEVEMTVGQTPITNSNGEPVGAMKARDFVDYFGSEQDSLASEEFTLYYASVDGEGLIREVHRGYYEDTMSREQAVIKYMQESPESSDARVAISPNINIINMTTSDGTCYLDMDMSFYDAESNIPYNVALYAIVNSLCELPEVHSVTVSIIEPAESALSELSESVSGTYERNNEIVLN